MPVIPTARLGAGNDGGAVAIDMKAPAPTVAALHAAAKAAAAHGVQHIPDPPAKLQEVPEGPPQPRGCLQRVQHALKVRAVWRGALILIAMVSFDRHASRAVVTWQWLLAAARQGAA